MAVQRKPLASARINSDAATFHFDTEVAVIRMANQEVGFAVLRLPLFATQDPPDLEKTT